MFVVCATFLLLIAGGLVTSNDASLAVPDWPTSFGSFHMPRMTGGVLYEHGHRMIAASITLLIFALAIWTWLAERQRWLRALTALAVLGVVAQAALGGLSVLSANWADPRWRLALAVGHGVMGQIMFCLLASIAVFTSAGWHEEPAPVMPAEDGGKLRFWTGLLVFELLLQLLLGAAFRHVWTKWGPAAAERMNGDRIVRLFLAPHMVNSLVAAAVLVIATVMVMKRAAANPQYGAASKRLKLPAMLLHILLLAQLGLGFAAFMTRVVYHMDIPQPEPALVWSTVAHQTVGALMLLCATVLAIQVRRALCAQPVGRRAAVRVPSAGAVTA